MAFSRPRTFNNRIPEFQQQNMSHQHRFHQTHGSRGHVCQQAVGPGFQHGFLHVTSCFLSGVRYGYGERAFYSHLPLLMKHMLLHEQTGSTIYIHEDMYGWILFLQLFIVTGTSEDLKQK